MQASIEFLFCIGTEVSGQCVISNGSSLMIPDGTNNVTIWCDCGYFVGPRWFFPNRDQVRTISHELREPGGPYYINMKPSPLIIPMFTNSYTGNYTCSPDHRFPTIPPGDTITLTGIELFTYLSK